MSLPAEMPALASKVSSIIRILGLTQEEVGEIVDASPRSISRWVAGTVAPQRTSKLRLIELAYVAEALSEILPRDHANLWMLSPNRLLEHDSPADRVHAGRYKDVLNLIEALADGIVV
jgi:transcriptional regulator with XRE-family HTH domain